MIDRKREGDWGREMEGEQANEKWGEMEKGRDGGRGREMEVERAREDYRVKGERKRLKERLKMEEEGLEYGGRVTEG